MKIKLIKKIKTPAILLLIGLFFVFPVIFTSAQENTDYILLAELPNLKSVPQAKALEVYIPYIFNLAIGLSAVAAVVMIVFGGLQYMTTDALQGKQQGRERIMNAVKGLVLVITAYLILFTINPNLLEINLSIDPAVINAPGTSGGGSGGGGGTPVAGVAMTEEQKAESNEIKKLLEDWDVWPYRGPCEEGQTKNCVNLNGLPDSAQKGLIDLNRVCDAAMSGGCNIIVTGGTEGGHKSHGVGKPMVDLKLDPNLGKYIKEKASSKPTDVGYGIEYKVPIDGKTYSFVEESNPPHWHVIFK